MKKYKFIVRMTLLLFVAITITGMIACGSSSDDDDGGSGSGGSQKSLRTKIIGTWVLECVRHTSSSGSPSIVKKAFYKWKKGTVLNFKSNGTYTDSSRDGSYKWSAGNNEEENLKLDGDGFHYEDDDNVDDYSGNAEVTYYDEETRDTWLFCWVKKYIPENPGSEGNDPGNGGNDPGNGGNDPGNGGNDPGNGGNDPGNGGNDPNPPSRPDHCLCDVLPDYPDENLFPIYPGDTPPNIEGVYLMSPYVSVYSSDGYYASNKELTEMDFIRFSNFNESTNTLNYENKSFSTTTNSLVGSENGYGVYISGRGNNFTVFFETSGTMYNISVRTVTALSGTKSSNDIKNLHYFTKLVYKGNDPEGRLMKVGTYRIFKDGDGISKQTQWPSSYAPNSGTRAAMTGNPFRHFIRK